MQPACVRVCTGLSYALQLLARRASLLRAGTEGVVRGLDGVGRGQGGCSQAQRACCVVTIFLIILVRSCNFRPTLFHAATAWWQPLAKDQSTATRSLANGLANGY
eukprot:scaffold106011_cov57-Phaeocystis_antarctica.AAC.1